MHMAINLVTYQKGGKQADMVAAAKQLKALALRHGAEDLQLSTVIAGPDAGQWVLVLSFSNFGGCEFQNSLNSLYYRP
jgi:hypothetical protein